MAFEPGGYADKLGNRYEGRWVARQLLFLLNEQIRSVTLESVGDDEAGVDLWIERYDGLREAQQCKAENGTKPYWSLADLKRRGVLDHLRTQLQRDANHTFTLVSGSPATPFADLSRSARDSTGDAESFHRHQIQAGSKRRQSDFSEWCRQHGLLESDAGDRATAFDLLSRSGFHLFVDDRESREVLRFMAGQAVAGDPDAVIALLANFAADNLRKAISVSDITQHLRRSGLEPRGLFADERIGPRLDELQEEFDDSIWPHFAGGRAIDRPEVGDVLKVLDGESTPDAIVLHGPAGHGKSGILFQLTQHLRDQGTPFLALRLDRKAPVGSPRQFGESLGLPESPVNCLVAVSGGKHAILILDQLDALRWTSSHSAEGLEVCKGLLRESRSMRSLGRRISIVLCCRTFDLEHDPQIRAWLKPTVGFAVEKVAITELPEARVRDFGDHSASTLTE